MRLKSIKLAGFKSFVDPTKVNLPGNLCAIVGPNGCGKSNIIDAVRWVMGESSAKNLRGESATDVIFNGSTSRQPVGQASIELMFDNNDRTLAGEFASYNEVSIRRTVTREGQSTYYLNNQKCRRRDVTDLFLGTGLGPRSYSIIEQGMISRLIESRPEELRVYIEEAAGISRYKERRRDTSNRISRARENLERLQDIREELGRQLETLKRQAAAAEQYTELKQNERQHKSQLATLQWRDLKEKLLDQRIGMGRIQDQIVIQCSEQDTRSAQMDVQKEELALLNESFTLQQGEFYSLGADIARLEQSIEHQQEQQLRWQADMLEAQQQLSHIDEACAADSKELNHLQQQQDQLAPDTELASAQLSEAEITLQENEEQGQEWQLEWQQKTEQQAQLQRLIEVAKTSLQHQQKQAHDIHQDNKRNESELKLLVLPSHEDAELLAAEIDQRQQDQDLASDELQVVELKLQQLRLQERDQLVQLEQQVQDLGGLSGQLTSLQMLLKEAQQGIAEPPSSWQLDHSKKLMDTMQVDAGWEAAVEHVLQDWLGGYVLPKSLTQGSSELSVAQGLSLLIPSHHKVQQHKIKKPHGYTSLLDKVNGPAGLEGLLAQVYIADDWKNTDQMLGHLPIYASVISSDGLWQGHGWLKTPPREGFATGVLERKQQIKSIEKQQQNLQKQNQKTQTEIDNTRQAMVKTDSVLTQLRQAWQANQSQYQQQQQALALLQQKSEQGLAQQQVLQQRIEEHGHKQLQLQGSMAILQEEVAEHELLLEVAQADLPELNAKKEILEAQLVQSRLDFNQKQQCVIQLKARMDSVLAQITSLNRSVERLQEQQLQWREKQAEISVTDLSQSQTKGDTVQDLTVELEVLLAQRLETEAGMEQQRQTMAQVEQIIRELEQQQAKQGNDVQQQETLLQEQRLIERELEVNANNIKQTMMDQNVLVEKLAEMLPDGINQIQLSALLEQCQSRIKRLGAINLVAIEEYQQQQERKLFLDQQNHELVEALDSLEQAINKIDKETRARFKQTFDKVNESLNALFPKVFGGGRASLELTDDDMLATGVTIMAQPPGKRNSSIHLLSGGEKALTAIALVFSIFQLNPSPFCMLDEVDAPLDDANVERYARLVKEMSAQVQFIYISHNKIAMKMATQLLGITMQESGVSRLVTVDMEQAINMTEQTLSI